VTRIGLVGGMSWESTSIYYALLNRLTAERFGAWHQPLVLIDSLNFQEIVALQASNDWDATGELLVDSAQRLERAGASVLAIAANTMHMNYDVVNNSVSLPVIDIRDAIL
jgi:aspartate racemase